MATVTCCAFWFSTISVSFMVFAFLAPFWLGRLDLGVAYYYGLWFNLQCYDTDCTLYSDTFDSDTVPLVDRSWSAELLVIPVMATIGLVFGFLSLILLEIMKCCVGRAFRKPFYTRTKLVIIICTIFLFISSVTNAIASFMGIYAASEYYKDNIINHGAEFPWSLLSIIIATLLVTTGFILYVYILCYWDKYCEHYNYRRWVSAQVLHKHEQGPHKSNNNSKYGNESRDHHNGSSYSVPAFSFPPLAMSNSIGMSNSMVGKGSDPVLASRYSQDKMMRSQYSKSDYGILRRSMHDSPRILRETSMKVYVQDEGDYLQRLRDSRKQEERSRYTGAKSEPIIYSSAEPSVLDILYRESRKNAPL